MLASSFFDPVLGLDVHFEMVPTPAPVPTPIPNPFIGIVFDPLGLAAGIALGAAIGAVVGAPFQGPVLYWTAFPATNTGTEAKHVPGHILIPPGVSWAPFPKTPKPVIHPGETPKPALPVVPENDAIVVFGSKTVSVMGSNAVRLGDIALSCSEPLRLPSSVVLAVPKGAPILIGGPPSLDLMAAAMASLRTRFVSDSLHALVSRLKPSRFRNLLHRGVCFLTGHPVDVAAGKVITEFVDIALPGPLPLTIERNYSSAFAERDGPLGHGWSISVDQGIWRERGKVVLLAEDGREIEFDTFDFARHRIAAGQEIYNPIERLTLRCLADERWLLVDHEGRQREFAPVPGRGDGRAMIQRERSRCGYHEIQYFYDQWGRLEWIRDCGGRELRLVHDPRGRLVELHLPQPDAEGLYRHRRYAYDAAGDLVEVEDSLGHRWRFAYVTHLLTRETDRNGLSFHFAYDGLGEDAWCVRTWGDGGIYDHEIAYDKQNRVTFVTNSLGHTTRYHMNLVGQVIKVVDPLGGETCFEYDPRTLRQVAITDPLGHRGSVELDEHGDCVALHQADGTTNFRSYDPQLRVLARSVEPHGAEYRWDHDVAGRMCARIGPLGDVTRYAYDNGLLSAIVDPDGVGQRFEYDAHKNLVAASRSDGSAIRVTRDGLGRVVAHHNRRSATQGRSWDTEGRLLELHEPHGVVRRFEYDAEARLRAASYAGRRIEFEYTAHNRPSLRREAGSAIKLEYDTEASLRKLTDEAGDQHCFEYDAAGRVIHERDLAGRERRYRRDALGRAVRIETPERTRELSYDAVGRLIEVRDGDGGFERYRYREDGALLEAENRDAVVRFELDPSGRVLAETVADRHGQTDTVRSAYSLAGRRIELCDAMHTLSVERDLAGQPARLRIDGDPQTQGHAGFERDPDGLDRRIDIAGVVQLDWRRDAVGRPLQQRITSRRGVLDDWQLEWANDAQLVRQTGLHTERRYAYDLRARPTAVYERDHEHLRLLDERGAPYETRTGEDRDYAAGATLLRRANATFVYDDEGRLRERRGGPDGVTRFAWNDSGLLREVTLPDGRVVRFEYDAFARRLRKRVLAPEQANGAQPTSERRWVWDGARPIRELGSDTGVTCWIYEPDSVRPIARLSEGELWAIVTDSLGTVTELVDSEGEVRWSAAEDLLGRFTTRGAVDQPLRRPGQYHDDETGLTYNRHRYFSPEAGLFISPDPLGLGGGTRSYGYCVDPLTAFDLLGWISEFIYRAVRPEEIDTAMTDGLSAKNPAEKHTPFEHVYHGSEPDFKSQFISTSDGAKGERMAQDWARRKNTAVVKIDVSKLDPDSIVDLSTGDGRVRHLGDVSRAAADSELVQANKWAKGKREVLIVGRIPADAIVEVKDYRSSSSCT